MSILQHIDSLESALGAKAFPSMSPWWRTTLERFYTTDKRQLVLRVGRRGGKSSTLCRIAVLEALFGEHDVPPGDIGVVAIVSVSRDEASQRLRTIKAILDALRVPYKPIEGGIELEGQSRAFKTFAASVAGVSGFTAIAVIADECAKWRDADTGANPATEVLASLRPTMATQPHARIFLSSSPLGLADAHAVAFDMGDTEFQSVAYAPTWEANPSVTEEQTHGLEPDDRKWRREYKAEPQAGSLAAFDPQLIDAAFGRIAPTNYGYAQQVMLLDPTSGGSDEYAWCAVRWRFDPKGIDHRLEVTGVAGYSDLVRRCVQSDAVVAKVAQWGREHGCSTVHADQFERFALASAFSTRGFRYVAHSWTAPRKERAVERLRQWLRDGTLVLPEHKKLRDQLLAFEEQIAPSGALTFRGRQGGHDDYAMLLMLAALVDIEPEVGGGLPGSPLFDAHRRAYAERVRRLGAGLALRGVIEGPEELKGVDPKQRQLVLERIASGESWDFATSTQASRVAQIVEARGGQAYLDERKKRERIAYNHLLHRTGSTILTEADIAELKAEGLIK